MKQCALCGMDADDQRYAGFVPFSSGDGRFEGLHVDCLDLVNVVRMEQIVNRLKAQKESRERLRKERDGRSGNFVVVIPATDEERDAYRKQSDIDPDKPA